MKRKTKYQIFTSIILALILGFFGFGHFTGYGATECDIGYAGGVQYGSCDCFCCQGIYGAGYESCGTFGFFSGLITGAILGSLIIHFIWKAKTK